MCLRISSIAAIKSRDALAPHLEKNSLEKRKQLAEKLDAQELGKKLKGMGLPF